METAVFRILVSGSHGFVGRALTSFLQEAGHTVVPLVRSKEEGAVCWDPESGKLNPEEFEGFDAVIHLAGENIATGRWTKKKKDKIFQSRVRDTWFLSQVLLRLARPPKTLICASAMGFYGNRPNEILTEESPPGNGFLSCLCKKWEEATIPIENRGTRVIHTRFGLILHPSGGILKKMNKFPVIFGNPNQIISWIALGDVIGGIDYCLRVEEISGPVNFTSPYPVIQEELIKTPLRIPACLVRLLLGQMGEEMLLSSSCVYPEKLIKSGYVFRHPIL